MNHFPPIDRPLVIVPTYNESGSIRELLSKLFSVLPEEGEVLVVDDKSPDGTGRLVRALQPAYTPRLHLMERSCERNGLGAALLDGFTWGKARAYDAFCTMDADLSHDPAELPALLEACNEADMVIGSRYVAGGGHRDWPLRRRLLSRTANALARVFLKVRTRDATSGFRIYRRAWIANLDRETVLARDHVFQVEMTLRAERAGCILREVPILFSDRSSGRSKLHPLATGKALWTFLRVWRYL